MLCDPELGIFFYAQLSKSDQRDTRKREPLREETRTRPTRKMHVVGIEAPTSNKAESMYTLAARSACSGSHIGIS